MKFTERSAELQGANAVRRDLVAEQREHTQNIVPFPGGKSAGGLR